MKLAIVGSRSLRVDLSYFLKIKPEQIVTGGAFGVDRSAAIFAQKNKIKISVIRPDYTTFGKTAPIMRNIKIVNLCDSMLAIWDGRSKGTMHAVNLARRLKKPVEIFLIKNGVCKKMTNNNDQIRFF